MAAACTCIRQAAAAAAGACGQDSPLLNDAIALVAHWVEDDSDGKQLLLEDPGLISDLVQLLRHPADGVAASAAACVERLANHSAVSSAVLQAALPALVAVLQRASSQQQQPPLLVQRAAGAVWGLAVPEYSGDLGQAGAIYAHPGAVEAMVACLRAPQPRTRLAGCGTFSWLAQLPGKWAVGRCGSPVPGRGPDAGALMDQC